MSYNKNIWKRKDRITKEKLNHMEDGIYNAHNEISPLKYIEQDVKAMKFSADSIDDLYLGVFLTVIMIQKLFYMPFITPP